jgi:hypothetical protein
MKLLDWWNDLQRRMAPPLGRGTLASGALVSSEGPAQPERSYVYLPAGTDYKKLAINLIQQSGYIVITGDKKPGGQSGSRKKRDGTRLPRGITLPTGIALREHVRMMKEVAEQEENRKLGNKAALRRILERTIGVALKAQGAAERKIKNMIDRELRGLESRYYEALKPRNRQPRKRLR